MPKMQLQDTVQDTVQTVKTYRCVKGHIWQGSDPFEVTFYRYGSPSCNIKVVTCLICCAELLEKVAGMQEVIE